MPINEVIRLIIKKIHYKNNQNSYIFKDYRNIQININMKIRSPYIVNEFKLENPILRLRNNFVVPLSREKMRCTFSPIIQNRFKFSSTTHGNKFILSLFY